MHSSERVLISLPYITSKERCYERIYWKLKRQVVAGVHESYRFVGGIFSSKPANFNSRKLFRFYTYKDLIAGRYQCDDPFLYCVRRKPHLLLQHLHRIWIFNIARVEGVQGLYKRSGFLFDSEKVASIIAWSSFIEKQFVALHGMTV